MLEKASILIPLFFLALAIYIYYVLPLNFRKYILFVFSIVFISAISVNLAIFSILFSFINFYFAIILDIANKKKKFNGILFYLFILVDIVILALFKYFNLFFSDFISLFKQNGIFINSIYSHLMLPVGISYYTFQSIGYLIRINRGTEHAESNFAIFSTYLLFFPKLIAGPVERSNHFFPQLKKAIIFNKANLIEGGKLFLWGLFKKIAIADVLYSEISQVYSNIHLFSRFDLFITLITHTIYIYCDFSGYTDIARGIAKCFGIDLLQNFNRPILAKNVAEFWRRWHISLSSWCNDFIYNPFIIKFRKHGNTAVVSGLFLTFFIVGIWHGSNLTFVTLGLLQGVAIVYEFYTKKYRIKIASKYSKSTVNLFSRVVVYLFMSFSMIFFFSNSLQDAWYFITHLCGYGINDKVDTIRSIYFKPLFIVSLLLFLIVFIVEILEEKGRKVSNFFSNLPIYIRIILYCSCVGLIWLTYAGFNLFYYARF